MKALEMLPVRVRREDGWIRFGWIGPTSPYEIVTTIDLDEDGIRWRPAPVVWKTDAVYPIVESAYGWSSLKSAYQSSYAVDGTAPDISDPSRIPTGAGVAAVGAWRSGRDGTSAIPRLKLNLDMVETKLTAEHACNTAVYLWGLQRRRMELQLDASHRWLRVNDRVYIIEHKVVPVTSIWQIEARTVPGSGLWRYVLEEVDGVPGHLTREAVWGERDDELFGEGA
jgi:hypothetical protein